MSSATSANADASTACPPDFMIAGAPKAATTSLYETLSKHPQVFFPSIKEPHFFAPDLPSRHEVETEELYDGLYASAPAGAVRGDGSVCSAVSEVAISAVLRRSPGVKLIFVARNPVDLLESFHNEMLKGLRHDHKSLEDAWRHQLETPPPDRSQSYREICSVGNQVRKLYSLAPKEQVLVLFFDDICQNPRSVFLQIAEYLGIQDNGTQEFVHENARGQFSNPLVAKIMIGQISNKSMRRFRAKYKEKLNKMGIRPYQWLSKMFLRPVAQEELTPEFRKELLEFFEEDIRLLEKQTGRDLSAWRGDRAPTADAVSQVS